MKMAWFVRCLLSTRFLFWASDLDWVATPSSYPPANWLLIAGNVCHPRSSRPLSSSASSSSSSSVGTSTCIRNGRFSSISIGKSCKPYFKANGPRNGIATWCLFNMTYNWEQVFLGFLHAHFSLWALQFFYVGSSSGAYLMASVRHKMCQQKWQKLVGSQSHVFSCHFISQTFMPPCFSWCVNGFSSQQLHDFMVSPALSSPELPRCVTTARRTWMNKTAGDVNVHEMFVPKEIDLCQRALAAAAFGTSRAKLARTAKWNKKKRSFKEMSSSYTKNIWMFQNFRLPFGYMSCAICFLSPNC